MAIKLPRKGQLTIEETESFLREARSAARLHHPSIVAVHEVGKQDDQLFIVSDYVHGLTLADWLTGKRPTPTEAAELCAKITDAVQHAHENGVIHRDLKPSNIMLDDDGQPHIMDFGLAKRDAGEITMTVEGRILGTPAYMSPEQARGEGHEADQRSDVYSLGVILFELLTGELPFRGNARMLIHQVINEEAPSPRRFNGNVARDLETICLKCLEKTPDKRYQTARDLGQDLRRFLAGEPIDARPVSRVERGWRWCRRNAKVAILSLALLTSLAIGTVVALLFALHSSRLAEQRRQQLYMADMNEAVLAWNENNMTRFKELLKRNEPTDVQTDLRKFEWYYLWQMGSQYGKARRIDLPDGGQSVAFSPDGQSLAVAHAFGHDVTLWNVETCGRQGWFGPRDESRWLQNLAVFSPDSRFLAYLGADKQSVILHDMSSGREDDVPLSDSEIHSIAFSPSAGFLALGCTDGTIRLLDVDSKTVKDVITNGASYFPCLSPHGRLMAATDRMGAVKVWNFETKQVVFAGRPSPEESQEELCAPVFSPDRRLFGFREGPRRITLYDISSHATTSVVASDADVYCLAFSPDSKLLTSAGYDRSIRIWKSDDLELVNTLKGHFASVMAVAFSPDGRRLASVSLDHTVLLWDVTPSEQTAFSDKLQLGQENLSVAMWPDGQIMVTTGSHEPGSLAKAATNNLIRFWDLVTLKEKALVTAAEAILCVAVSPTGDTRGRRQRWHCVYSQYGNSRNSTQDFSSRVVRYFDDIL